MATPRVVTKDEILRNYKTPGHPTAFSAPHNVSSFYSIPVQKAKEALEHEDGYNIHREFKKPAVFNPHYVYFRRKQIQADLIDVRKLSMKNSNFAYIFLLIDIFTRRMWAFPLKTKEARETHKVLEKWLNDLDVMPSVLMTDAGTEFKNRLVKGLLDNHGIYWQRALGTSKASYAERANKTLQILIYKYLTAMETERYIDVLPELIETYNSRPHRSLENMTPEEADLPRNEDKVRSIHFRRYNKVNGRRKKPIYKVGDLVRIKTDPSKVSSDGRAYSKQFKEEYYKVISVNTHFPIPMYILENVDDGEKIEGAFYSNEMSRVRGDTFKIARVLTKRRRNGRVEALVRWKHFGPQWDQWIPEETLQRI